MIYKEIVDNKLIVYFKGKVIYKRWLKTGNSVVFNSFGLPSWNGDIKK